ncbi:MAG: hypothetical protein A2138_00065 [Deltaproteobacteria bacterium RBG_16_71_12]|nr:MAG: hypothetical protein A2138_00065 [Deltaproteobacteria bacterium RBG_16_71_12]
MVALASLGATGLVCPAHAQSWPSVSGELPRAGGGEGDVAVVVGITDYAFLDDIAGAAGNANDWYQYLVRVRGVPPERVRLLTNNTAIDFAITKALKESAAAAKRGGVAWFIFIGHGAPAPSGDDGLLLGADTQPDIDAMQARGLPQQQALDLLRSGQQDSTVALFDACFSGKSADGERTLFPGMQATPPVRRAGPGARSVVLSSSDSFAGPLPGQKRPAFSYLMLGSLRGWADGDRDGAVSLAEATGYTTATMRAALKASDRLPSVRGDAPGLVLAKNVTESSPEVEAILIGRCPEGTRWEERRCQAVACPAGMKWNGDACVATQAAIQCPPGTAWDGTHCATGAVQCPPGTSWDGKVCSAATVQCPAGTTWNGSFCAGRSVVVDSVAPTDLSRLNLEAERARDRALAAEDGSSVEERKAAWCALAAVSGDNRYRDEAKVRCDQYDQKLVAAANLEQQVGRDYDNLGGFLELSRRTSAEKIQAVDVFLDTYGKLDRQEVQAAKKAREELVAGGSATLLRDVDGDRLLIDACPNEAEDYDGDSDTDGCRDVQAGEMIGDVVDDTGDFFGDIFKGIGDSTVLDEYDDKDELGFVGFGVSGAGTLGANVPAIGSIDMRLSWGVTEGGMGMATDLSTNESQTFKTLFLDGYAGLQLFEIPHDDDFGVIKPSAGVYALWNPGASDENLQGLLGSLYLANTSRIGNVVQLRIFYRYNLFGELDGASPGDDPDTFEPLPPAWTMRTGTHVVGADLSLNMVALME